MDKFINPKTGKTILQINDDGSQEVDKKYFQDIKDGTIKLTKTSVEDEHSHTFTIDGNGDGKTTTNSGHSHKIVAREVIPAANGHAHQLPLGA